MALVTLYLPFVLLMLSESMQSLGRLPDVAATLGASSLQVSTRITCQRLLRPMATAGLVIFSQVLGVIITPRILGSDDVTLAMLIDDLLKRSMDTSAALRVAGAEFALAIPLAAVAAYFVEAELKARARHLQPALRFRGGRTLALIPVGIFIVVPLTLVILSMGSSPILNMMDIFQHGPTLKWYGKALSDAGYQRVVLPSLGVWITAAVLSIFPATLAAIQLLPFPRVRQSCRWLALVILFIPQNALGVLLFMIVSHLPSIQASMPPWILAGAGQALPDLALSFLIMDRVSDRLVRSLNIAATLGATAWQRAVRIALPSLLPSIVIGFIATALVSLDDIIFVRYLPRVSVGTFATELFGRARYEAAPDLAAACVLVAASILLFVGVGFLVTDMPRLRRKLPLTRRISLRPPAETVQLRRVV